jgi:hypothetical protein
MRISKIDSSSSCCRGDEDGASEDKEAEIEVAVVGLPYPRGVESGIRRYRIGLASMAA